MPLTVKDILEKTFKKSFKGYDEDEVDKFLDLIIDEFKAIQTETAAIKDELETAKEQLLKVKNTEETIMKTLVSAQKSSERIISEATHKAELIISSAESTAKSRAEQTTRDLSEAQNRLEELKACAQGFASNFANMVNAQAAYFEQTYQSYFGKDAAPLGGINTDALDKIDRNIAQSLKEIEAENMKDLEPAKDDSIKELDEQQETVLKPADDKDVYMELHEINRALNDIENPAFEEPKTAEQTPDFKEPETSDDADFSSAQKPEESKVYSDYSWLYESGASQDGTGPVFKDIKEEEEFKSLIDDILD